MKKTYTDPTVKVITTQLKDDILLQSDAEIDVGDLIEPESPDVNMDIDPLFN